MAGFCRVREKLNYSITQKVTKPAEREREREFPSSPRSEIQLTGRNAKAGSVFSTFFKLNWHAWETDSFKGTVFQLMGGNHRQRWGGKHPDETTLALTPYYSFLVLYSPALCWPGLIESAHSCVEWVGLGLIQHWGGSSSPQVKAGFSLPRVPWLAVSRVRLQSKSKGGEDSFRGRLYQPLAGNKLRRWVQFSTFGFGKALLFFECKRSVSEISSQPGGSYGLL